MRPTVSVVIPYYNSATTIQEAIDSVLNQTWAPDEILIIDDASTESAEPPFVAPAGRVRVLRMARNSGPGAARGLGTEQATSTWMAYLDADDAWLPTKLERQMEYLAANPGLDGAHCGTIIWRNGVDTVHYADKPARLTPVNVCEGENILPPAFIVRRDRLLALGNWTTRRDMLEDWDLSFRMMAAGMQIGFVPEALIRVRRDGHQSLTSDTWRDLLAHLNVLATHQAFIVATAGADTLEDMRAAALHRFGRRRGRLAGWLVALGASRWRM